MLPPKHAPTFNTAKLCTLSAVVFTTTLGLSGCGGGDKIEEEYKRVEGQVSNEYDRLSDKVVNEYKRVEDKLTDDEKDMADILESVFLPDKLNEDLDDFLDKITPEGGTGGLYVGHFVEIDDGNTSDIDIGAMYFDIPKAYGSVTSRISYQQQPCQNADNTLSAKTAIKVDDYVTGTLSGRLDSPEGLDIKYVRDLDITKPIELSTLAGKFDTAGANANNRAKAWVGSFEYREALNIYGQTLSSGVAGCNVVYTIAPRSNFKTYPLDYQLGDLGLSLQQAANTGTSPYLSWSVPKNTTLTLVSQINVNKAKSGANGYALNQVIRSTPLNDKAIFTPKMTDMPTNYAFVVQAFDANNQLIGFQSLVADLPSVKAVTP